MRQRESRNGSHQPKCPRQTVARYNTKMMERLQKALEEDASVDLSTVLPDNYQLRRQNIRLDEEEYQDALAAESTIETQLPSTMIQTPRARFPIEEIDLPQDSATIISKLSVTAMDALELLEGKSNDGEYIATRLKTMLLKGELLCSPTNHTHLVKYDGLVVKCFMPGPAPATNGMDFTEYTSLQYLERHVPNIPAPRPHGLIVSGRMAYLIMTHVPGQTLESVWPLLTSEQKSSLQCKLQDILVELRDHPIASATQLGGVQGEGCKDRRRAIKISSKPIQSATDFWNFIYKSPIGPTVMYTQILRSWFSFSSSEKCVFTHGDLRPANIHVIEDQTGQYHIAGILDWEMSGFYPESWESCKITNCLSPIDAWDWYSYIAPCVSPSRYSYRWLLDNFWDCYIASNSGVTEVD